MGKRINKKPLTKTEIKYMMRVYRKQLRELYNKLDNLADEAEIAAESLSDRRIMMGGGDALNAIAARLTEAGAQALSASEHLYYIA